VAVLSLGGVVFSRSIRVAGDKMDDAVADYLKTRRGIVVGERTAELVKIMIGSAYPDDKVRSMEVHGRDALTGNPKSVEVSEVEIREALAEPVRQIVESVKFALQSMPPELSSDLVERGIVMTGGGALLRGLDVLIHRQTGLPVRIADNPLMSVVMGAAKMLDALT
jgi:rod shape-determining protein MreB